MWRLPRKFVAVPCIYDFTPSDKPLAYQLKRIKISYFLVFIILLFIEIIDLYFWIIMFWLEVINWRRRWRDCQNVYRKTGLISFFKIPKVTAKPIKFSIINNNKLRVKLHSNSVNPYTTIYLIRWPENLCKNNFFQI